MAEGPSAELLPATGRAAAGRQLVGPWVNWVKLPAMTQTTQTMRRENRQRERPGPGFGRQLAPIDGAAHWVNWVIRSSIFNRCRLTCSFTLLYSYTVLLGFDFAIPKKLTQTTQCPCFFQWRRGFAFGSCDRQTMTQP
jgi:hypothetical protein